MKLDEKGFVFLAGNGSPYYCKMYHGSAWLFYWHPDKRWVTCKKITDSHETHSYRRSAMSDEHAQIYHDQNEKARLFHFHPELT